MDLMDKCITRSLELTDSEEIKMLVRAAYIMLKVNQRTWHKILRGYKVCQVSHPEKRRCKQHHSIALRSNFTRRTYRLFHFFVWKKKVVRPMHRYEKRLLVYTIKYYWHVSYFLLVSSAYWSTSGKIMNRRTDQSAKLDRNMSRFTYIY